MKKIISVLLLLSVVFAFAACSVDEKTEDENKPKGTQPVSYTQLITKIYNDLADTLPEFTFSNEISETYDEGYSYTITVKASQDEFNRYLEAVRAGDFTLEPITGENYYLAKNANGFKLECSYIDGSAIIQVSR